MFKRWISLLVTLTMLTSLFSATAFAQEPAQADGTQVVTTVDDTADTADKPEKPDADKPETGDTGSAAGDGAENTTDGASTDGDRTDGTPPTGDPEADPEADPLDPEAEQEPPTAQEAEQMAAAAAALAALPDPITWDAFAAVEAAGAALAAVPAHLQAQVEGADKLQPAIDALLQIYNDALAALDPTADVWENQQAIKAFAEMKKQMDAALYVKPTTNSDMSLMGDEAAQPDLSWLDAAMLAYADAEATIIPAGGDMALLDTTKVNDCQKLQEALNHVKEGEIILINKNITLAQDETLLAQNAVTYTINTNKKTISFGDSRPATMCMVVLAGTVTISGGGLIYGDSADGGTLIAFIVIDDKATLTLEGIRIAADREDLSMALVVQDANAVNVNDCEINTSFTLEQTAGNVTIKKTTIANFYDITYPEDMPAMSVRSSKPAKLTLDIVNVTSDNPTILKVEKTQNMDLVVKIDNTTLATTAKDPQIIRSTKTDETGTLSVTLSNVLTSHPLDASAYTLGQGQALFDTIAGGNAIAATLSEALLMADIALREDYTQTAALEIGAGKTLDISSHTLQTGDMTVAGTLLANAGNIPQNGFTVTSTGTFSMNDKVFIAPRAADGAAQKPVFGIHDGGEMRVHKDGDAIVFTAVSGEMTIQSGFDNANTFEPNDAYRFEIEAGATVWLSNGVALSSPITGVRYAVATDASGKQNYETLAAAVEGSTSIKVVRDLKGMFAPGEPITISRSTTIDLGGHIVEAAGAAFDVLPQKKATVIIKNGEILTEASYAVSVSGAKSGVATMVLEGVNIVGGVVVGDYTKLTIQNCEIMGNEFALGSYGSAEASEITVTGTYLSSSGSAGCAVKLHSVKKLTMSDVYANVVGTGIVLMGGTIALNNVAVYAYGPENQCNYVDSFVGGHALVAVANQAQGNALTLTINGGTYHSQSGYALAFGYAGGVMPTQRAMAVAINGGVFIRDNGTAEPLCKLGDGAPAAVVSEMVLYPGNVADGTFTLAKGAQSFAITDGLIVCKELSTALGMLESGNTLYLTQGYEGKKEALNIKQGTTLHMDMGSGALSVKSIESYGYIANLGGTLSVGTLKLAKQSADNPAGLYVQTPEQLGNTMVELVPHRDETTTRYATLQVGNGTYVGGLGDNALFTLVGDAHMGVRQRDGALEFIAISGTVQVNDSTFVDQGAVNMGANYLTIRSGARVVLANGITLTAADGHIEGDIVYSDVQALVDKLATLPPVEDLTYRHEATVAQAIALAGAISDAHKETDPAKEALETLDKYQAEYLHAVIRTNPKLLEPQYNYYDVELGSSGAAVDYRMEYSTEVWDMLEEQYTLKLVLTEETDKFVVEKAIRYDYDGVKATENAQPNDSVEALMYFERTTGTPVYTSPPNRIVFRAVAPIGIDRLVEMLLDQYSHTVNLQHKSQTVYIRTLNVFENGATSRGYMSHYTIKDVELVGTGKQPLDSAFTAVYQDGTVVLTPIAGKLAKNKTYTGKLTYRIEDNNGSSSVALETQPITVRVTDVKPNVKISFETIDLFDTQYIDDEENPYYEVESYGITLTGTDAHYVEDIEYGTVEGATIQSGGVDWLSITSDAPLTKRTLKPVIKLIMRENSGFDDIVLENTKKPGEGTIPIKLVETSPAIKLAKNSFPVNGEFYAEWSVDLLPSTKKNAFDMRDVETVEVLETINGKLVSTDRLSVGFSSVYERDRRSLGFWLEKPIGKTTTFTLRFHFDDVCAVKDLPVTLVAKPITAKLTVSGVEFNPRINYNYTDVPLKINTTGELLMLETVNGVEAGNGEAVVDGIIFGCNLESHLNVDARFANLTEGSKRYTIRFKGVEKPVTLTVNVVDKPLTVKLAKTGVTLNSTVNDWAEIPVLYGNDTLKSNQVTLEHTSGISAWYDEYYGRLNVRLNPTAQKTETVYVNVKNAGTDPKKSRLKLTVKRNDTPFTLAVRVNGKLSTDDFFDSVSYDITVKGSAERFDAQTVAQLDHSCYTLSAQNMLALDEYDRYIEWKPDRYQTRSEGKYRLTLSLNDDKLGVHITSKPFDVVAQASKLKLTAQPVVLYEAVPAGYATIRLDADRIFTPTKVEPAKPSNVYAVERVESGTYLIFYKTTTPFEGTKWKDTDSIQLNVTVVGVNKPITVTLPITNVRTKQQATE